MRDLRFLVTFPAGFEEIVPLLLRRFLPSVKIVSRSGGMVLFSAPSADPLLKAPLFFTNVFAVVREWASPGISFPDMIHGIIKKDSLAGFAAPKIPGNSFRLRFSRASRFESVDKRFVQKAEEYIASSARMRLDKLSGGAEFWFLIRQEGPAYFACKLPQHPAKKGPAPRPGELKSETALLVAALAQPSGTEKLVCDPFAGYGSIPAQLEILCPNAAIVVVDSDSSLVSGLKRRFSGNSRVRIHCGDARNLAMIETASVDLVAADPPWGEWEAGGYSDSAELGSLYSAFLAELDRILAPGGKAVVLTGAKDLFERAAAVSPSFSACAAREGFRTDILVNGKKAAVYRLNR